VSNPERSKARTAVSERKLGFARMLAKSHLKVEDTITGVAYITSARENCADEPIKLLEVNTATSASGVFPVSFGPTGEIPYHSTLIELTPGEARKLNGKALEGWPKDWEIGRWLYRRHKAGSRGRRK
jgi:hypothetical protein